MQADVTFHLSKAEARIMLSLVDIGLAVFKRVHSLADLMNASEEDLGSLAQKILSSARAVEGN